MIALEESYDVAVVVSGADSIPTIELMKRRRKHAGGCRVCTWLSTREKR